MKAVSPAIIKIISQLQSIPSISEFSLGGGTNLALQFNHRISEDIDLFCSGIVGKQGFKMIEEDVKKVFGKSARNFDDPCDINDQFCFIRFFIDTPEGETIKVELLQNMKNLYQIEIKDGIKVLSKKDIGIFKLISASNRFAKKDIYDLDFITDEIPLIDLFEVLMVKRIKFNKEQDRTIFDLNDNQSPIEFPELLLKFDKNTTSRNLPMHSHDHIKIIEGNKSWIESKISWRSKVRKLFTHIGKDFPGPIGIKIK
ncbi:nucleotidyl transferase AbiEii/AbiGii toxin family protein [Flavobacterium tegetincola]|uniref:nucleotidyl transferase AbiEii/AbiGii toxin family protein n=1 Tax=Flavobacterium tegetincola TaxID=150172 RepID=UPI0003F6C2E7|nr:nucleotidyl transferase AbiEii/AbiGii toxin family protein [Flavobacterium tegetincola]